MSAGRFTGRYKSQSGTIAGTLIALAACAAATHASAASMAVELACASDFYAYCSQHDPDSAGARRCMDANGNRLSQRCVNALIRAGEISKAEVDRRAARNK